MPSAHRRAQEPAPATQSAAWSQQEQSSTATAANQVLSDLAAGNRLYEQRFGFTYIVCATGKSAGEMLGILRRRLNNDRDFGIARGGGAATSNYANPSWEMAGDMSVITTHVLDTVLGKPAAGCRSAAGALRRGFVARDRRECNRRRRPLPQPGCQRPTGLVPADLYDRNLLEGPGTLQHLPGDLYYFPLR